GLAALRSADGGGCSVAFQSRLLEAEPSVLALLARDPFDGAAPRYVRTTRWRYRFADAETRRRTGDWWTRERLGDYCPTPGLGNGGVRAGGGSAPGGARG